MNNAFVVALITPKAAVARSALRTLYKLHINSRLTPTDRSKNTELRIVISLNNTVSTVCIMRQVMIIIVTRLILRLISGMEEMAVILLFIVNFLSVLEVELLWNTQAVLRDPMHTSLLLCSGYVRLLVL